MTEIGIDVKTMNVARRSRRKRKMISMTRNAADERVFLDGVNRAA